MLTFVQIHQALSRASASAPSPPSKSRRPKDRDPRIVGDRVEIPLTRGYIATVDVEDYEAVAPFTWGARVQGRTVYAATRDGATGRLVLLHRLLLRPGSMQDVDHIDGDGLNNRRSNLRACDHALNMANQKRRDGTASQYKGVARCGDGWHAYINVAYKRKSLGGYASEEEAGRAYDAAARHYFGDYAATNFVGDEALSAQDLRTRAARQAKVKHQTTFRGVRLAHRSGNWEARLRLGERDIYLGTYQTEVEAAQAYDAVARYYLGDRALTNLEGERSVSVDELFDSRKELPLLRKPGIKSRSVSPYRGVRKVGNGSRWQARLTVRSKTTSLGCYETPEEAARIYDKAAWEVHGERALLNFPDDIKRETS